MGKSIVYLHTIMYHILPTVFCLSRERANFFVYPLACCVKGASDSETKSLIWTRLICNHLGRPPLSVIT